MSDDRWHRLEQLFAQAVALSEAERAEFIAQACGDDAALAAELRAMLVHDAAPDPVPQALNQAAVLALADRADPMAGQRLGPWRVGALIAHGGMGAVYRAERDDGQFQQQAAVKLLNPALISPAAQERLAQERQILARLSHPHIARLLDGGRTPDGLPYLVMDYVDGQPIDTWCHRGGLDTAARLRLFVQVCDAVDYAHRNLVVHRDLKPSNILVDTEGSPKLLDFGIAKLLAEADPQLTRSGEQVLTPSHAAPEQISGGAISTATDVYALGVLLYDLLTGRRPHDGQADQSPVALARAIVETDPPRPSTAVITAGNSSRRLAQLSARGQQLTPERLARELAGDLDNIVLMALRKAPERRYPGARALADDIERHLAHLPVKARPDAWTYRAAKFLQRHPVAVPVSAAVLVAVLAGSAGFTWQLVQERNRAVSAEASARAAEATARQAEAAATRSAQQARESAEFSASMLEGTGANAGSARQVSVLDLLAQASARIGDELGDSPALAAELRLGLARALHSWGQHSDAASEIERILALTADWDGRGGATTGVTRAKALQLMSAVRHDQDRRDESLGFAQQANELLARVGNADQRAQGLLDLAIALSGAGRDGDAVPVYRQALAQLALAHPDGNDDTAWALNNLAWTLQKMVRLDEAAPLYDQAIALQRRLGAAEVDLAQTLSNRAGLAWDRGRIDEAERGWRETLAIFERVYGAAGHAAVARAQHLVALVLRARGRYDETEPLLRAAVAMNRRLLGPAHRYTAITIESLGLVLLEAGRPDEAEPLLRQAKANYDNNPNASTTDRADGHALLAALAYARGDMVGAERHYRTALQLHQQEAPGARSAHDRVAIQLGRVLALQGHREEGLAIARQGVAIMKGWRSASHWLQRWAATVIALPPFEARPTPEQWADARASIDALRAQIGPDAREARDLDEQLRRAAALAR